MARSRRLGGWLRKGTSVLLLVATVLGGLALTATPASAAEPVATHYVTEGDSGYEYIEVEAAIPADGDGDELAYRVLEDGIFGNTSAKFDFSYENHDQDRYRIGENQDTFTVEVAIKGDKIYEPEEFFTIVVYRDGVTDTTAATKVIIQDDDVDDDPTFQADHTGAPEGDSGTKNITFELTRIGNPHGTSVVDWSLAPGLPSECSKLTYGPKPIANATPGTDYQNVSDRVSFAPGETSKLVTVPIVGDLVKESTEQLRIVLTAVSFATIQNGCHGYAHIVDNDGIQGLQVYDAATLTEGHSGTKLATFTIERRGVLNTAASVRWSTTDTAPPSELPPTPGLLYYDADAEAAALDSGPTTAGVDYTPVTTTTGIVNFPANQPSATFTVAVRGDTVSEPTNEKLYVKLSSPVGVTIVKGNAGVTIKDDDTGLWVGDETVRESKPGNHWKVVLVPIWRTGPINKWSWVNWDLANGSATALSDYVGDFGIEYFAPGEIRKDIKVKVRSDLTPEVLEQFRIDLSEPGGASIRKPTGTVEIEDDDGFSVNDVEVTETQSGTSQATFTISLPGPAPAPVSVNWITTPSNKLPEGIVKATPSVDYVHAIDTVTFAPGETSKTASVTILGDTLTEVTEGFAVYLWQPVGATLKDKFGIVTIRNYTVGLSVGDATQVEGNSGTSLMTYTVTRHGSLDGTVSATWGTAINVPTNLPVAVAYVLQPTAETAGEWTMPVGSAAGGTDYTPVSNQTVTFGPGEPTKTISVPVIGDTAVEGHESLKVTLSQPVGIPILDADGVGVIQTDDSGIKTGPDTSRAEGYEGTKDLPFKIERTGAIDGTSTVNWTTVPGTAQADVDFTAASGTLTFLPGETLQTIMIPVIGDTQVEPSESFSVQLSAPTGGVILDASATTFISNDDGLKISNAPVLEPASGTTQATFTISLTAASATPVTVKWATANGTVAIPGVTATAAGTGDYTAVTTPQTVTFLPGQVSKTVTVTVKGDVVNEGLEMFQVNLSSPSGAPIVDGQGAGLITSNDTGVFVSDASVVEGTGGTAILEFTVYRRGLTLTGASVVVGTSDYASTWGGTGEVCVTCQEWEAGLSSLSPPGATAGTDYIAIPSQTIKFQPGVTEQKVRVTIPADALDDWGEEQLFLNILSTTGLTIRDGQGSGVIKDDDAPKPLVIS